MRKGNNGMRKDNDMNSERPAVLIRLAGKADAEWIAEISHRTFSESFGAQNTKENMDHFLEKQFTREKLIREVGVPGNIFLLAYIDGEWAGYAYMRENSDASELGGARAIEIARIYAGQDMIGKGVGKALMEYCLTLARKQANDWIWLGVWEHNRRAIEFYKKWGFEKFGDHVFMLGHEQQTDWKMRKRL
jgi:ribosomal protein S18 acetylase RimI-like enzyme